jgi:hypothetical protein
VASETLETSPVFPQATRADFFSSLMEEISKLWRTRVLLC